MKDYGFILLGFLCLIVAGGAKYQGLKEGEQIGKCKSQCCFCLKGPK